MLVVEEEVLKKRTGRGQNPNVAENDTDERDQPEVDEEKLMCVYEFVWFNAWLYSGECRHVLTVGCLQYIVNMCQCRLI